MRGALAIAEVPRDAPPRDPVADIVPHGQRARWLSGERLAHELETRAADSGLAGDLATLAGQTIDEL